MMRKAGPGPLPPQLTASIPRDVTLTAGGRALAALAILIAAGAIAAAIALTIANRRSADDAERRAREAVAATADVVAVRPERGENRHHIVTYRYDAQGVTYTGETRLREHDRRAFSAGDRVAIGYVRSAPDMSWIAGAEPRIEPPIGVVPLVSLSMLTVAALIAWNVRRQWLLLAEGRPAIARVTSSKRIAGQHGAHYRVGYEFQTLSGATVSARYDMGRTPPPVGTSVSIVYHRDTPRWSAPYPLQLVRPRRVT
jgi:hypothetical protein